MKCTSVSVNAYKNLLKEVASLGNVVYVILQLKLWSAYERQSKLSKIPSIDNFDEDEH